MQDQNKAGSRGSQTPADGPAVFSFRGRREDLAAGPWVCWTALHRTISDSSLIVLEFELQSDPQHPLCCTNLQYPYQGTRSQYDNDNLLTTLEQEKPIGKSGMHGDGFGAFSDHDLDASIISKSIPLRHAGSDVPLAEHDVSALEVFDILAQINEQLSSVSGISEFCEVVAGLVKDITQFHRVMVYEFDEQWNGQVVAELVDWDKTKDLFRGLYFPHTDIPVQARALYKINKVRSLYDRDLVTARIQCRNQEVFDNPLDMTHCYLRALSPIHIRYLANMGVRSSMSISITAFGKLWGLIACHTYENFTRRASFLSRKLCHLMADQISLNLERVSSAGRLTARKLLEVPSYPNPVGFVGSSVEDLLKLFKADFGMLTIDVEAKCFGDMSLAAEGLDLRNYYQQTGTKAIRHADDLGVQDSGSDRSTYRHVAGILYIPLGRNGFDSILFLRRSQLRTIRWAGNPYEKILERNQTHKSDLFPRESFRIWSESVQGRCEAWAEMHMETAAILCLIYSRFIDVWREKDRVSNTSKLTSLLLENKCHEVRTPVNAIINYLEIAMDSTLPPNIRDCLTKSHNASQSLVLVINDLLDLTSREQGRELFKKEPVNLCHLVRETIALYKNHADELHIHLEFATDITEPLYISSDQSKLRQVMENLLSNAVRYTKTGSVMVALNEIKRAEDRAEVEVIIKDTGQGMTPAKLDAIFSNFDLVDELSDYEATNRRRISGTGMGLAIVARIVKVLRAQLKVESVLGHGSVFTLIFSFEICKNLALSSGREAVDTIPDPASTIQTLNVVQELFPVETSHTTILDETLTQEFLSDSRSSVASEITDSSCTNLEIIVADDNSINRNILSKRLKSLGHNATMTNDGSKCCSAYLKSPLKCDAVLMDIQMPILDGMAAAREIRKFEKSFLPHYRAHVPIIAISASLLERDVQDLIESGFDAWLLKPVSFPRLKRLLCGLKDDEARRDDLYQSQTGYDWKAGGWLALACNTSE